MSRRRKIMKLGLLSGFTIPDFSGFNITKMWTTFKSSEATVNHYARISRNGLETAGNIMYAFYDQYAIPSMDGQVSSTTTEDEDTTLREWLLSGSLSDDYYIHSYYCQITGDEIEHQSGSLTSAPYFVQNNNLKTRNLTPALKFQGIANSFLDRTALPELANGEDFTVITITQQSVGTNTYVILNTRTSTGGTNSRFMHFNRGDNANAVLFRNTGSTSYVGTLLATNTSTDQRELINTAENAVELKTYLTGVLQDTDVITGDFDNQTFMVGSGPSGTFLFDGMYQGTIVCDAILDQTAITNIGVKLASVFQYDAIYNFVTDGNSLTVGQEATPGSEYPTVLGTRLTNQGSDAAMTNVAVGGQTTQDMEADAVTTVDNLINGSKRNILLAWEGRNDLNQNDGLSVADAYANYKEYCQNRQAAGWEVITATILPSWTAAYNGDSTVTGYNALNTDRLAFNALLRADQNLYDGFVDFALNTDINTFGNNEQGGYVYSSVTRPTTSDNGLFADGTHLEDEGYQVVSNMFFEEIIKLVHK